MAADDEIANAMATFLDMVSPVREATIGYRLSLIEAGIGADYADMMAHDFHNLAITVIRNGLNS